MDAEDCLPEYFAMKHTSGYYIYQNTIYKSAETHHMPLCVLWPIVNMTVGVMNTFAHNLIAKKCLTRRWNGYDYNPCEWKHTGFEIEMTKVNGFMIVIPVISISEDESVIIPYNNLLYVPTSTVNGIARRGIDIKARVYTEEPVDTVPSLAGTRKKMVTTQIVTVTEFKIPPHVKRLLIREAIQHKDTCPISCEDITQENADVTSCGHVFIASEIKTWLSMGSSNCLCPVCKQKCSV